MVRCSTRMLQNASSRITIIVNSYDRKCVGITAQNTKMFVGVSYVLCPTLVTHVC